MVKTLGGISAIAIRHPHYYSSGRMEQGFGDVPVYLHSADRQWVMRPDEAIEFWDTETKPLSDGLTLVSLWRPLRRRHRVALGGRSDGGGAS